MYPMICNQLSCFRNFGNSSRLERCEGKSDGVPEALRPIDPPGTLMPGSRQYDVIVEMIEDWIRQHGPEEALEMARKSAGHLDV